MSMLEETNHFRLLSSFFPHVRMHAPQKERAYYLSPQYSCLLETAWAASEGGNMAQAM